MIISHSLVNETPMRLTIPIAFRLRLISKRGWISLSEVWPSAKDVDVRRDEFSVEILGSKGGIQS